MLKNIEDLTKEVKQYMPDYLKSKGIPADKSFPCINPAHVHNDYSKVMHYDHENKVLRCFGDCARKSGAGKQGQAFDLLDVIGWDLHTDSFMEKLKYACEMFHVGDFSGKPKQGKPFFIGSEFLEKSGLLSSVGPDGQELKDRTKMINAGLVNVDKAAEYLASRGIERKLARRHSVGYLPGHDNRGKKYDVVLFPADKYHVVLRNAGRDDNEFRYERRGPAALFNADAVLKAFQKERPLFVVEGEVDALSIETAGGFAVALSSANNVDLLWPVLAAAEKEAGKKTVVIAACDNDAVGRSANNALLKGLKESRFAGYWVNLYNDCKDANEALQNHRELFCKIVSDMQTGQGLKRILFKQRNNLAPVVNRIGSPESAVTKIPTGLSGLDEALGGGIFAQLYVIGAMSGMGKTTLAMQIADNLAKSGHDVMYISLEMSQRDLACRSISKYMFLADKAMNKCAKYAMDTDSVMQYVVGDEKNEPNQEALFRDAKKQYEMVAENIFLKDTRCSFEQIEQWVAEYKEAMGTAPIVFVDYLQQLRSEGSVKKSDKQDVDSDISRLKDLSKSYNIPVFVLSSFNRLAYYREVMVDAFKESGSIEYSADCLIAMQLYGSGKDGFDFTGAMEKTVRLVELVVLKQRSRPCYKKVLYKYYTPFNYFTEYKEGKFGAEAKQDSSQGSLAFNEVVI